MTEIASFEAKTHFSELLRRVERQGEKFVVTMRGKPVAMLVPLEQAASGKESVEALLERLRQFRAQQTGRKPLLKAGETLKDFAREGLA
jgi:prevent-host-death family protein